MQMAKISQLFNAIPRKIILFGGITDPTTAGVNSSIAMEGDIIIARVKPGGLPVDAWSNQLCVKNRQMISKSRISTRTWICRLDRGEAKSNSWTSIDPSWR